jgi:hypothetical protein
MARDLGRHRDVLMTLMNGCPGVVMWWEALVRLRDTAAHEVGATPPSRRQVIRRCASRRMICGPAR